MESVVFSVSADFTDDDSCNRSRYSSLFFSSATAFSQLGMSLYFDGRNWDETPQ